MEGIEPDGWMWELGGRRHGKDERDEVGRYSRE